MCKKPYKTARNLCGIFYIAYFLLPVCFADTTPVQPPVIVQGAPATPSANQKQLTQINALFDQADYMHLANPYNVVTSLMLNE